MFEYYSQAFFRVGLIISRMVEDFYSGATDARAIRLGLKFDQPVCLVHAFEQSADNAVDLPLVFC